jgi:hypothetical protein
VKYFYQEKTAQLRIDALKEPAARSAAGRRGPYPGVEIWEISPPGFVLDQSDEPGAAASLMGPADHGSARPLTRPSR